MSDTPTLFALHQAAKEGNTPLLKKAQKKDVNKGDQDGWTAMHWAAWNGNPDGLRILIGKGGDVDNPENKGSTPLHVAATYGHQGALELLVGKNANLYSLDNFGRTAAKVAAFYQKADCCRYLDTLAVRWEVQSQDFVQKLQKKAMKDLQKRARKTSDDSGVPSQKISYDYATAPSGLQSPVRDSSGRLQRPSSGGPNVRKGPKRSVQEALRQNFELRTTNSAEQFGDNNAEGDNMGSRSATDLGGFTGNTFHTVRRPMQGSLINTLHGLPLRIEPDEATRDSVAPGIITNASTSETNLVRSHGSGSRLPQLQFVASQPTSFTNDSTLSTFLNSLDLTDCIQILHREKLDLEALALCSEQDLISIGLPLGPRKKILNAILRRKQVFANPSKKMTESEL